MDFITNYCKWSGIIRVSYKSKDLHKCILLLFLIDFSPGRVFYTLLVSRFSRRTIIGLTFKNKILIYLVTLNSDKKSRLSRHYVKHGTSEWIVISKHIFSSFIKSWFHMFCKEVMLVSRFVSKVIKEYFYVVFIVNFNV